MKTLVILLSTYNGHQFLREQLDSILAQDIRRDPAYELSLCVRDDGSKDDTLAILEEYRDRIGLAVIQGKNVGAARSFWDLVQQAPEADFYAFCDQDDVWMEDKLSRAMNVLKEKQNDIPQLYCSSVQWVDTDLNDIQVNHGGYTTRTDLPYALLYSISPGCTFVFNRATLQTVRKYDFAREHVEIHDWLMHKIVAMFGEITYDRKPGMYYRQHGNNAIGSKNMGLSGLIERTKRFLTTDAHVRSDTALSLLKTYEQELETLPEQKRYVDLVANYRTDLRKKRQFLHEKAFRRGGTNDLLLSILILTGKI